MDRSHWSCRFSAGDHFFCVVFSRIVIKRRLGVLAGSIRFMGPRISRRHSMGTYALVSSTFQRRPGTAFGLDTTRTVIGTEM